MQRWLFCLLAIMAVQAGCPALAQAGNIRREEIRMETDWEEDKADFETLFEVAVQQSGAPYIHARQSLLGLGDQAIPLLQARRQAVTWEERLTAEALIGWLTQQEKFVQCDRYIRGEFAEPATNILGRYTVKQRAYAISNLGREVTPHLLEIILKTQEYQNMDEEGYPISSVFGALLILKDARAVEPMLALARATNPNTSLRVQAVSVLGELNESRTIELLQHLLADRKEPYALRATAARNLGVLRAVGALPLLIKIFQDVSEAQDARLAAAEVIGILGDVKSSLSLTQALPGIGDLTLLGTVIGALRRIGDRSSLGALRKVEQQHSDSDIGILARDAREKIVQRLRHKTQP